MWCIYVKVCLFVDTPKVINPIKSYTFQYGEIGKMMCLVESTPLPNFIYWIKNAYGQQTKIYPGTSGTDGMSVLYPSMKILKATTSDTGNYTCFVGNAVGISKSLVMNVNIAGSKKF